MGIFMIYSIYLLWLILSVWITLGICPQMPQQFLDKQGQIEFFTVIYPNLIKQTILKNDFPVIKVEIDR